MKIEKKHNHKRNPFPTGLESLGSGRNSLSHFATHLHSEQQVK